jgi:atypical dual specificity phosphatase
MWHWSLNWAEITPQIVVDSCPMVAIDLRRIVAEAKVTAILSVQHD